MTRAIRKHLGDFLAIIALFIMAVGIGGYILSQERLRFPFVQQKPTTVKVELPDAQAVQPGQGQTVRVAGVKVGDIGTVDLKDGRAVVSLQIDPKYKGLIRQDGTALLRSKTGLKDMFVEVDPGTGKPVPDGGTIAVENTAPDVDPDEVLSALDRDTRDYLKLLISGAGKGLKNRGFDLRETLKRFSPLHRDLKKVTTAVATRRHNLRRLVHNYGLLVTELGRKDKDITRLVQTSNAVLGAFAQENGNVSRFVAKLPGTLRQTSSTLTKVDTLGQRLSPALDSLRPAFSKLDAANKQVLPLAREGTPIVRDQIRPFTRIAQPYTRDLGIGARGLAKASPDLATAFGEFNRFFNLGAYNPGGKESISDGCEKNGICTAQERARSEGYLFWLGWVADLTDSIFNTADANGNFRRITLGGLNCNLLKNELKSQIPAGLPPAVKALLEGQIDATVTALGGLGACAA